MPTLRCDAVVVQILGTEVDEHGRPIGEHASKPLKIFRASGGDFWAHVDGVVAEMQRELRAGTPPAAPTPAPPDVVAGRRKRR